MKKKENRNSLRRILALALSFFVFFLLYLERETIFSSFRPVPEHGSSSLNQEPPEDSNLGSNHLLGVPLLSKGIRHREAGILALKVMDKNGMGAGREPVHFLHAETLRLGKGFTNPQGEFRVFSEGIYLFRVGGFRLVRKILPPVTIRRRQVAAKKEKPLRVRLALGGRLIVSLRTFPKGEPFVKSRGILLLSPREEKALGIHWRRRRDLSSETFLQFAQGFLKSRREQPTQSHKKNSFPVFDRTIFQNLLTRYKNWVAIKEEEWIPYVDPSFLLKTPDKKGILDWEGLPNLPLRWGLEDVDVSLNVDPPFRKKEYAVKEDVQGKKTFKYLGSQPKDLSGSFHILSGQKKIFRPKVYSGNGVIVSIPMPKGWEFQTKPVILSLNRVGDPRKGGSIDTWKPERKGNLSSGRFLFPDLETGKTKEIFCWIRNPEKTVFSLLKSKTFVFQGGWKDLGVLAPLRGEDCRLQVLVDGNPKKTKKLFPLTFHASISGYHMNELSLNPGQGLVIQGARGRSMLLFNLNEPFFHSDKVKEGKTLTKLTRDAWKFVKKKKNEILYNGVTHISHLLPVHIFHLAPRKLRKILIQTRIIGPQGILPKDLLLAPQVEVFPPSTVPPRLGFLHNLHSNTKGSGRERKRFQGFFILDQEDQPRAFFCRVSVPIKGVNGQRMVRNFSGFTTEVSPPISIDMKPQIRFLIRGLEDFEKKNACFFLQPKSLFEKTKDPTWGPGTGVEKTKGSYRTRFPIPVPEEYVLLQTIPSRKKPLVLGSYKVFSTTKSIDVH